MKLILIFLFLPLVLSADPGEYLKANNKFYAKTIGDGLEKGIEFAFRKKMPRVSLSEIPIPILEISNDTADCQGQVKIEKIQPSSERFQWVYYVGVMDTSVIDDSGGCIALVRWQDSGNILKIIDYYYITDL